MRHILSLTKRNILLFFRDRLAVFFSFLSTIVLVALYFLFIGRMFANGIEQSPESAAVIFPDGGVNFLVYIQMMAGVLILNSMSLTIGVFSTAAKDFETRRVDNFLLTRAKQHELLLSYTVSGFIVSFALNLFTWLLSFLLIGVLTGFFLSFGTFMMGVVILIAASAISCALMLLVTALVRSSTAMGVIGGIAGTFLGFLCGIYMPYSGLGGGTAAAGSFLPYTHLTIWMKRTLLNDALTQLQVPAEANEFMMRDIFSAANVGFAGIDKVPLAVMLGLCGVFAVLCFGAAWLVLKRRITKK